jgi:cell division protein FtsX
VANLLYARAADREREVAIRGALGATRWRLLRQLLAESTLLALAAGAIGAITAIAVTPLLGKMIVPGDMAPPANTGTDWRLFVFTFVASLAAGILAGLLPAWKATRLEILPLLKNSPSIAVGHHRLRSLLVIGQVAISCLVLICAGLAARSVQKLAQINLGFRPDHIFLASVDPSLQRYSNERSRQFQAQLLDKLRALPGVTSASLATHLPASGPRVKRQPISRSFCKFLACQSIMPIFKPWARGLLRAAILPRATMRPRRAWSLSIERLPSSCGPTAMLSGSAWCSRETRCRSSASSARCATMR